jgi:glycosyltransferase involved in cell wall biosynthesis
MNNPKVSICIPAYKRPGLMKICLDSICKQIFTDYEVIITDDSPNNEVSEIVDDFKYKIKNLKYFKNEKRMGSPEN